MAVLEMEPVSVNLKVLVKELQSRGMEITEKDIVVKTNPDLETKEVIQQLILKEKERFTALNLSTSTKKGPSINAWDRADIRYRMNQLKR